MSIKDGLVAILPHKSDFAILQEQGWYRIPEAFWARIIFPTRVGVNRWGAGI